MSNRHCQCDLIEELGPRQFFSFATTSKSTKNGKASASKWSSNMFWGGKQGHVVVAVVVCAKLIRFLLRIENFRFKYLFRKKRFVLKSWKN